MTVSILHGTTSVGTPAGNGEIAKTHWNAEHVLTMEGGYLLGRSSPTAGAAMEVNAFRVIASSAVASSHTGSTTETTLATVSVPAGALGANGSLRITTLWSMTNNANNKTYRVRYAGSALLASIFANSASLRTQQQLHNRNSETSQVAGPLVSTAFLATSNAHQTYAIDTTLAQDLTFTTTLAVSTDTVTLESYVVEVCYKA